MGATLLHSSANASSVGRSALHSPHDVVARDEAASVQYAERVLLEDAQRSLRLSQEMIDAIPVQEDHIRVRDVYNHSVRVLLRFQSVAARAKLPDTYCAVGDIFCLKHDKSRAKNLEWMLNRPLTAAEKEVYNFRHVHDSAMDHLEEAVKCGLKRAWDWWMIEMVAILIACHHDPQELPQFDQLFLETAMYAIGADFVESCMEKEREYKTVLSGLQAMVAWCAYLCCERLAVIPFYIRRRAVMYVAMDLLGKRLKEPEAQDLFHALLQKFDMEAGKLATL
jgi:hypothetical protein